MPLTTLRISALAIPKKDKQVEPGIWKLVDGRWLFDMALDGRGSKRKRKVLKTLGEARQAKTLFLAGIKDDSGFGLPSDKRKLSELANLWFEYHGHTLTSGKKQLKILHNMIVAMGDPVASKCTPVTFLNYRQERIEAGITENHMNHELTYLKSVFNELVRVGQWSLEKPFDNIKKLKVVKKQLRYLTAEEIHQLLAAASTSTKNDLVVVIKICLSAGCRFGEANGLCAEHVRNGKIDIIDSKNGRNRSIPISNALKDEILEGRNEQGPLFEDCFNVFKGALDRSGIILPRGQRTHVLRHTFASHFMMNGGDFLVLNKILGHETIQMTMEYAHLAPNHLIEAIDKNPLDYGKNVVELEVVS